MKCRNIFCPYHDYEDGGRWNCHFAGYNGEGVRDCESRLRYNRVAKPPGLWKAVQWKAEHEKYYGRGK